MGGSMLTERLWIDELWKKGYIDVPIIQIDPEFQGLISCLTKEEKDALEKSMIVHTVIHEAKMGVKLGDTFGLI
jgi:hypothetical protein